MNNLSTDVLTTLIGIKNLAASDNWIVPVETISVLLDTAIKQQKRIIYVENELEQLTRENEIVKADSKMNYILRQENRVQREKIEFLELELAAMKMICGK